MNNRLVLAATGEVDAIDAIARTASRAGVEVVAVALDLDGSVPLASAKDAALAAGAIRCHALDLREEFAREVMLPALRMPALEAAHRAVRESSHQFVTQKLHDLAVIERGVAILPHASWSWLPYGRSLARVSGAVSIEVAFADGRPHSVNEIAMTPAELIESIETITGLAAFGVLHLAFRALDGADEGQVRLQVTDGRCAVAAATTLC